MNADAAKAPGWVRNVAAAKFILPAIGSFAITSSGPSALLLT
ncbi:MULTISPECIES: hypothetical protein [Rhizobium]|uniref:Uncharacterized protein n=1 Tax=Rhizobium favelukesii TaxID=348824 RepID=W6RTQ4_9HYPH|nr:MULTISPECIES: hypothetical protein [Rhizobium]CDM57691.1 putative predicted protein [Rhizobium favelukesii]